MIYPPMLSFKRKIDLAAAIILAVLAFHSQPMLAADPPSTPATNSGPRKITFSDFKIITDRNIFNTRRYARSSNNTERRETPRAVRIDSLTLVGTMSYEKGWFAFFDGTSSDYRKAAQPNEKVAGFTVSEITPMHVKLQWETNEVTLRVGTQLRRENGGSWQTNTAIEPMMAAYTPSAAAVPVVRLAATNAPADSFESPAGPGFDGGPDAFPGGFPADSQAPGGVATVTQTNSVPAAAGAAAGDAGGGENDVLRRLMQRREQELNK